MPRTYTITVTETQVRVISEALDFWYRIQMGQFKVILELFCGEYHDRYLNWDMTRLFASNHLMIAKKELFPNIPSDNYLGIASAEISDEAKIAADIYDDMKRIIRPEQFGREFKMLFPKFGKEPRVIITENESD